MPRSEIRRTRNKIVLEPVIDPGMHFKLRPRTIQEYWRPEVKGPCIQASGMGIIV